MRSYTLLWMTLSSLLAGCGAPAPQASTPAGLSTSCAPGATVDGIDVSEFQGTVDWSTVRAAGRAFAFIRVSDGLAFGDDRFADNWPNARAAGVVRGPYQYFRASQDPVAQANLLVDRVAQAGGLQSGDLPPVLDVEETDGRAMGDVVAGAHAWLERIQQATGRVPIIYSGAWFAEQLGGGFSAYPLWVANWGVSCPSLPSGWPRWTFWQYADDGHVGGIGGAVDLDRFAGSLGDLLALANGTTLATRMTCGDWARVAGYSSDVACEWSGNSVCGDRGQTTGDCSHCCDRANVAGLPTARSMSCGDWANANGYRQPHCESGGNRACGGRGPATADCDYCCDWADAPWEPEALSQSCGQWADAHGLANPRCEINGNGACGARGVRTADCDHCCGG